MKRYATSFFQQLFGLMFDNTPGAEMEFVLKKPTRFGASVHTLFMKYPIQVEWLNEAREIQETTRLNPWVINYVPKKEAKYVIEKRVK